VNRKLKRFARGRARSGERGTRGRARKMKVRHAAGPHKRARRKWTPERILKILRREWRAGRDVRSNAILERLGGLYRAALRHFRTWRRTREAAGVPLPLRRRKWTPERILATIKRRWRAEKSWSSRSAASDEGGLYAAGVSEFGSWPNALDAAGIPPGERRRKPYAPRKGAISDEQIRTLLRSMAREGAPVHYTAMKRSHPRLLYTALKRHGPWSATLRAAGLDPDRVSLKKTPSRERVVEALRAEHEAGRTLLTHRILREIPWLYGAARRFFRSWPEALLAAGVAPRLERPAWTREKILRTLRQDSTSGLDLRMAIFRKRHRALVDEAKRHFGGWRQALRAAGISRPPPRVASKWPRERILGKLKRRWMAGSCLSRSSLTGSWQGLYDAAVREFGSWKEALCEAGVPSQ
jgi:hypothetical protein